MTGLWMRKRYIAPSYHAATYRLRDCCRLALLGLVTVAALLALALLLAQPGEAQTITVDDDGPADYDNLRDASRNASAGDTIFIYPGNYRSLYLVNNSISYIGSARDDVFIKNIIIFKNNNITIHNLSVNSRFSIENSEQIIFENIFVNSWIQISGSNGIFFYNSTFNNTMDIHFSSEITLMNNSISLEDYVEYTTYGVKGFHVSIITIIGNTFKNRDYGINIQGGNFPPVPNDMISKNTFENHNTAIYYDIDVKAEISYNVIKNSEIGIRASSMHDIKNNVFKNVETEIIGIERDDDFNSSISGFNILLMLTNICVIHKVRRMRK